MSATQFKITEYTNRGGSKSFRVDGYDRNNKRIRRNFDSIEKAILCQQDLEMDFHKMAKPETRATTTRLTDDQLQQAELAFVRLDGKPMMQAVDFYLANYRPTSCQMPLTDAFKQFLSVKEQAKRRPDTIRDLRGRVGHFIRLHPEKFVSDILLADIESATNRDTLSDYGKDNYRRVLFGFFKWCQKRGYCASNPVAEIERIRPADKEPEILSNDQVVRLLKSAREYKDGLCLPYVVLGTFCAIRPRELTRLSWQHIDLDAKVIRIGGSLAKMRARRVVDIPENALAWLKPLVGTPLWREGNWQRDFTAVKNGAEIKEWTPDAMRHTGISHHFAKYKDEAKTAVWAGNSPDVIHKHYRALVTRPSDIEAFWSIMPKTKKTISRSENSPPLLAASAPA